MRELPRILMVAAINPQAKNDAQAQELLDKATADLQVVQQDEAARLSAFRQLVQAERSGGADAAKTARENLNGANVKLKADVAQLSQEDIVPLRKRLQELLANNGGATPQTDPSPGNAGNRRTPPAAPASED